MLSQAQAADVIALLAGEKSAAELAHTHNVERSVVEGWRDGYLSGLRAAESRPRVSRAAVGALVVGALVFGAPDAWAATCSDPRLPSPLKAFCADSPAVAADMNGNFATMVGWVEAKTGPITDAGVLTPSLRVTGNTALAGTNVTTLTATGTTSLQAVTAGLVTASSLTVNGTFNKPISFANTGARRTTNWQELPGGNSWGSWRGQALCPAGQFVCGMEQRVESGQGSDDDTSVNSVAMVCCTLGY